MTKGANALNGLQKIIVLLMAKMYYRNKMAKDDFIAFVLEISMWKMLLVVPDRIQRKLKTEQNKKASNFDIIKGLGIHDRIIV